MVTKLMTRHDMFTSPGLFTASPGERKEKEKKNTDKRQQEPFVSCWDTVLKNLDGMTAILWFS